MSNEFHDENNLYHFSYRDPNAESHAESADGSIVEPAADPVVTNTPAQPKKHHRGIGRVVALILSCAVISAACGFGGAILAQNGSSTGKTTVQQSNRTATTVNVKKVDGQTLMSPAEVYASTVNSVVSINCSATTNYFGQTVESASSGSGFILTQDGFVVTNHHVIDGATAISIVTQDSTSYEAEVVGSDSDLDTAVLKVKNAGKKTTFPAVVLGDSSSLTVGDSVTAIGNALGTLANTLTTGVVSAKDRAISMSDGTAMKLLQTDCTVNSGNSGGPLFNQYGEVIGIINAKYSSGTSTFSSNEASIEGIGFAIPIDQVRSIFESIITNGYIVKPYIGVTVSDVSSESQSYGLPQGAAVRSVTENGPAAEPAPAEPQESPESQEPKAPKKPKKKKKKSRPKQGKKAPAKAKNAKPREKRPTLAESFESMERGCAYIGMQLLREYYAIRRGIGHVYGRVRARVPILWRSLRFKVVRRTEHFADEVLFPYRILHDETAELAAALRDKTPEGKAGRREAWRDYSRAVARPLNRIANFFAPIFGLAILAGAIAFFNQFTFALRVEYNGESIGYIAQESDFYEARDAMLARLINEEYIPPEDTIPTLSLAVAKEKDLLTKEELTDAIMRSSGNELVDASGFYLEGKFLGALEDGNEFLLYMDKVLNNYRTGEEHETVQFTKNIRLEDGVYPVSSLMTVSNLQSYLRSNKELRRSYTARPGETIEAIAKRYGLTLEEMYDLNTELEEYLTALRQQQLGYDPDSVILPDSGTPAEEWNARLEDISVSGETPLETAINNGMVLYMGLLYWPEDLPDGAAEELAAAAGDNNALYRLQYGITDETAEAPADEAPTDAATGDTADSTDSTTPAEDAESGETTTGTPMQTISLIPLEQVPLQGDEELLVVQMDVELGIQVTRRETYMANVQFGTTYQDNNKKPIGDTSTISAGIYGQDEVVADVTYIDGVRVGETVLSRTRLKDPVNQVIARGTQTIDDYFASTGGRFIWPADGGYFYGSLGSYGGHTGMDIACPLGTTVRASKAGTVTTALNYGWNYGYGKTVVINHGYGQITRYAHMSNVIVTVGQYVKQGQVIGYSGSTGNSTGPHLHFEIRIDGAIKAPENYIGKVYNR